MIDKLVKPLDLLKFEYDIVVDYLRGKYGECEVDYYTKSSFNNYKDGKTERLNMKKDNRCQEGLERHHILQNIHNGIRDKKMIRSGVIKFEHHCAKNLVYCDSIEHLVLHALIVKESKGKFGSEGFKALYEKNKPLDREVINTNYELHSNGERIADSEELFRSINEIYQMFIK